MKYEKYYLKDVIKASKQNKFTVISTFAGGGGSSTGYRLAGGKVLAVNEFVEEAVTTYRANYPNTKILDGDIKTLKGEDFLSLTGLNVGELDILDGSPPCSAFSQLIKSGKHWGKVRKYSDDKKVEGIEDLFFHLIRIANEIKPKVIVAENVKGILNSGARSKFNQIINAFEDIGYITSFKLLDSADFKTPQYRKRVIFICIREDVANDVGINDFTIGHVFPSIKNEHISIKEALDDIVSDEDEVKLLLDYAENSFKKKWLKILPKNSLRTVSPGDNEFSDINPKGSYFSLIRPSILRPSPTLTQRGQTLSTAGVVHYNQDRKFTINELKVLMGLPDDYILTGKFDQKAERICRMVAPKMMKAVAENIYEKVLKKYYEN